jgi:ABC-type oligopeptide transport system ATPase subunit
MADTPLLSVQNLKKHFPVTKGLLLMKTIGWVKAVDEISFTLQQGETLALVGESGCGKTTTAKLILRLEQPTSGEVLIDGKDVHALSRSDLKDYRTMVQAVFQDPWSSLSPRMRVRNIVAEPLVINQKVSRAQVDERVREVIASRLASGAGEPLSARVQWRAAPAYCHGQRPDFPSQADHPG